MRSQSVEDGHHGIFCEILGIDPDWFESRYNWLRKGVEERRNIYGANRTKEGIIAGETIRVQIYDFIESKGGASSIEVAKHFDLTAKQAYAKLQYLKTQGAITGSAGEWKALDRSKAQTRETLSRTILEMVAKEGPILRKDIFTKIGQIGGFNASSIKETLDRLYKDGQLARPKVGVYVLALDNPGQA
jgi:Mn-dependent DtxR family transcriptional regulator